MARQCELSGKKVLVGHRVSHSNIKSKHRFFPNLHTKRLWSPEKKRFFTMKLSISALRTIDRIGFDAYMRRVSKRKGL